MTDQNQANRSAGSTTKTVAANQKVLDALPLDSGTWRVQGVPGLYVRSRRTSRSFFVQRRVKGKLVKVSLGVVSMKDAKAAAMENWSHMKAKPKVGDLLTWGKALEEYLQDKSLAPKTEHNYRYNAAHYLADWTDRSMIDIGHDRLGMRSLQREITKAHGVATSNQIVRLISAVYRWARKVDASLPEPPTTAVEVASIPARDWALTPDELKVWWRSTKENGGELVESGVATLQPVKRMWWLVALLTGARAGSIEALRWSDIDLDKKLIVFRITKGNRPYTIPASDLLVEILISYRDSGKVPPSDSGWLFPSPTLDRHVINVRDDKRGVPPAHRMRHSFRTTLAQLGATDEQARLLLGHSMTGNVSRNYVTTSLVTEFLRPVSNEVATSYSQSIPGVSSAAHIF